MQKIGIVNCMKSAQKCTGANCLAAFHQRTGSFQRYLNEELELVVFSVCRGCKCYGQDEIALEDKVGKIVKTGVEVIHLGNCTEKTKAENLTYQCPEITRMAESLAKYFIKIVKGTHDRMGLKIYKV